MSLPDAPDPIAPMVRTSQIIVGAFVAGLVSFLVAVLVLRSGGGFGGRMPNRTPVLAYAAVAFALVMVPASLLVPRLVAAGARRRLAQGLREDPPRDPLLPAGPGAGPTGVGEALLPAFQAQLILGAALNEGPAFLAMVAYLLEGSPVALVVALALTVGVAWRFPTRAGVERWLEEQVQAIDQERRFEG